MANDYIEQQINVNVGWRPGAHDVEVAARVCAHIKNLLEDLKEFDGTAFIDLADSRVTNEQIDEHTKGLEY